MKNRIHINHMLNYLGSENWSLADSLFFVKKNFQVFRTLIAFLLLVSEMFFTINTASAEGSRSLYPAGMSGRRAFLLSWPSGHPAQDFNPAPTQGTMKVYAKAGETIYVGSSAQGKQVTASDPVGTIVLRAPNGDMYTSGTTVGGTIGLISTRIQELNGPNHGSFTSGYIPYTRDVTAAQEGIWEIDFVSPKITGNTSNENGSTPTAGAANYADSQWSTTLTASNSAMIAAWDVSVGSTANPDAALIPGRLFCTSFIGTLPGDFTVSDAGFNGVLYTLTSNGHVFKIDNNGQNGFTFTLFANNKGVKNASTGNPTYQSLNQSTGLLSQVWDPRSPDGATDMTHKLFFAPPSSDMPENAYELFKGASTPTYTWLKQATVLTPAMSNVSFVGVEGIPNVVGPKGAYIKFTSNSDANYAIIISSVGYTNRKLTGVVTAGDNQVLWDGKDGAGNPIAANSNILISGLLYASEVHFPFVDIENNINGINIQLLDASNNVVNSKPVVRLKIINKILSKKVVHYIDIQYISK